MKHFIVYDSGGIILRTGTCVDSDFSLQAGEGESLIEGIADDATQIIVNGEVVAKSGPTESEANSAALEELRQKRDEILTWCDWTQVPDSPLTDTKKTEWATYRQTLRDLPASNANVTSIDDVTFPDAPT